MTGRIIKGLGGLYTVETNDEMQIACKPRGIFRKQKKTPLPGDIVTISLEGEQGVIESISERRNALIRPPVANVDIMFIVVATTNPEPSLLVTDKLIAVCEENNITPILCFNKTDLKQASELINCYEHSKIEIIQTCAENSLGIEIIKEHIKNNICVFGGNSGVGKSSLLGNLGIDVAVGSTSKKIERGCHTTKHVELYAACGGYIADTPGFGDINYEDCLKADKESVENLFREFSDYIGNCRFSDCAHINEPDCAIKQAVKDGKISQSRYDSYREIYNESLNKRKQWE